MGLGLAMAAEEGLEEGLRFLVEVDCFERAAVASLDGAVVESGSKESALSSSFPFERS